MTLRHAIGSVWLLFRCYSHPFILSPCPPTWSPKLPLAVSAWLAAVGDKSSVTRRDDESLLGRFAVALQATALSRASPAGLVKIAAERFAAQGEVSSSTRTKRLSVRNSCSR